MAGIKATAIRQDLRRLFDGESVAGLTEAQLLDHVARRGRRAEPAFEAILTRHGPAVLACCRRVLGDFAAAEDAFQATFLILYQRAGSIRVESSIAPWLLHVARLAALKARESEIRRRARENRSARLEVKEPEPMAFDLDLLVRAEVDRLPAKYRVPVHLCYFEGQSHEEAALTLRWPVGTVRGRLSRAREMLRQRFIKRGVGITPAALAAVLVSGDHARAEVPQALREATLATATDGAVVKESVFTLAAAIAGGLAATTAVKSFAILLGVAILISLGTGITMLAGGGGRQRQQPLNAAKTGTRVSSIDRYGDPLPKGAVARLGTTRFRHYGSNFVGGRAFLTPDGKTLVTVGADHQARVWELARGRLIRSIDANEGALSSDGTTLFAAQPGVLLAVNMADGRELRRTTMGPGEELQQIIVARDGKNLAVLSRGGLTLIADDGVALSKRWVNEKVGRIAGDAAFSLDGRLLALAVRENESQNALAEPREASIRLLDVATGAELRQIALEGFGLASVVFAPDGKTLAAGVGDRTIRFYDVATCQERLPRLGREGALSPPTPGRSFRKGYREDESRAAAVMAFSPDGSLLASGVEGIGWFNRASDVPPITLWDVASGREVRKLAGHPIGAISLAFTPDGNTLVSSGFEPVARLWDVATGREIDRRPGHSTSISGLTVSPIDGSAFTISLGDGPILHWNPSDGQLLDTVGVYTNVVDALTVSPDGRALLVVDSQHAPVIWDVAGRKELRQLADDKRGGSVRGAFSPDGRTVTGNHHVWDVATGRLLAVFGSGKDRCTPCYSADGRQVTVVNSRGVSVWDIATGALVRRPIEDLPDAWNAAISPDGRLVAVGQSRHVNHAMGAQFGREANPGGERTDPIRIWEMASGKEVAALYGHTDISSGLAFSPDGRMLASVSGGRETTGDPGLRIWDVASGKPLRHFRNDPLGGSQLAYLPDGRSIVTAGHDGIALVWDVSDLADRRIPETTDVTMLEASWHDLASDDAPRAHRASWVLSADSAVPLLRDRLRPAAPKGPTAGSEVLRSLRAIAALERIGSGLAREVLRRLAGGDSAALATRDATAALLRLSGRK
jgi:RNA polymerase sigma factor (sigma-70 family)